jgi:zinc protease
MLDAIQRPISFSTPGGLRVLHQQSDAAPVVAIQFWVRAGSADEAAHEAGLAHVHEHMLFKGTQHRGTGEIARHIESIGGTINAWTSFDETVYHVVAPSRFFEEAFDVLADALRYSAFDADELTAELVVIQEEIRRGLDQPSRALHRALFERSFPHHPYGRPVIGTPETVASFTRDDVVAFYERWYRPSNITLVVVGEVEEATVRDAVRRRLGDWNAPRYDRPARPVEPDPDGLAAVVVHREVQHGSAAFAFRGLAVAAEDVAAFDLLTTLAGQGESSVLFHRLQRERGLVDNVWSYSYSPRDPGLVMFGVSFGTERLHREGVLEVVEAVAREIAHLRSRAFSPQEIRRARVQLESDVIFQRRTVQGIARRLGYFQTLADDVAFEQQYYQRLARVTAGELARVATQYLDPARLVAGLLLPDGVDVDEQTLEAVIRRTFDDVAAAHDRAVPAPDAWGVVRATLPSGAVVMIRSDRSAPLFSVRASVLGGTLAETHDTVGTMRLLADLLTSGTARYSSAELAERVESMAASLSGFAGNNSVGLAMTALSADASEALELFVEALLHSTFPEDEIARLRRESLHAIDASRQNPTARVMEGLLSRIYQNHPYGRTAEDVARGLRAADRDGLLRTYRSLVRPDRLAIAIVGDVDPAAVLDRLTVLLDPTADEETVSIAQPSPPMRTQEDRFRHLQMQREQAHIAVGFPSPASTDPDSIVLDVVAAVLGGQSGRLFTELRDQRSLAYSVGAYHSSGWGGGAFYLYMATSPDREDEALLALREQLERLRHDGVTDDEILRAKRLLLGRRDIALQNQGHRAAMLVHDHLYGLGDGHGEQWPARIESVGREAMERVIARWLDPQWEVVSMVSPRPPSSAHEAASEGDVAAEP